MSEFSIIESNADNLDEFSRIISQAFSDKFPFFFKSITEDEYIKLIAILKLKRVERLEFHGCYLLQYKGKFIGALNLIYDEMRRESFASIYKILRKKMNIWYALRSSLIIFIEDHEKVSKNTLVVKAIGIDEAYRQMGFGYKLLQYAEDLARNRNMKCLELSVLSRNTGAISLYEKFGFKIISTKTIRLAKKFLDIKAIYTMQKELE